MRITKNQLRRIIREEAAKSTEKYDDDSALTGDQDELPDELQKGIIDKTVDDREEEKNESRTISKKRLHKMIREALSQPPDDEFVEALRSTWDAVQMDVGIPSPTPEDKGDEASAMLSTYEPEIAKKFNALPFKDQDMMLKLAFDPEYQ